MSPKQREILARLRGREGQVVEVLTSQYTRNVEKTFVARAMFMPGSTSALRGLAARGYIADLFTYWKGATFRVVKVED